MATPRSAAVVLAGGKSRRLGRDKASEPLLGRALLQRVLDRLAGLVDEYVVVAARGQTLPAVRADAPVRVVEDAYPEVGPLGGIYTGLAATDAPYALAVACDMPLLEPALLAELLRLAPEADVVAPLADDFPQTLCAVYGRACLEPIRRQIESGRYKITAFFDEVRVRYLAEEEWRPFDPEGLSFQDLDREEDLRRAEALLRRREQAGAAPP